jgi:lipopolysaccharide transport system permease protein
MAADARAVWSFVRSSVRDKYLGSSLGSVWGIAHPLLMLTIFTFVFGYVYKVRLPGAETTLAYAIWLICGYAPWLAISESIIAAATSVVSAGGIIKNVPIKTEVLPIAGSITGLLPLAVGLVFILVVLLAEGTVPSWHVVFIPAIIAVQLLLVVAIGFLLAAVTVFFRDLAYALPNLLMVVLFASPIVYPPDSMPPVLARLSQFNPFYIVPEAYRAVLFYQRMPDVGGLVYVGVFAAVLGWGTLRVFRRAKGHFAAAL